MARARSLLAASGARLDLARSTLAVGEIELAADDPAAAERCFREGMKRSARWVSAHIAAPRQACSLRLCTGKDAWVRRSR